MKISIEFKEKKYTVVYGKLTATGATVKEAIDNLVDQFREFQLILGCRLYQARVLLQVM